jgi:hypothetical protein
MWVLYPARAPSVSCFEPVKPPAIRLVEAATRGFPNQLNRCGAKAEPGASFCMRSGRAFP